MLLNRVVPPGPPVSIREAYTGLRLGEHAPSDRPHLVSNFVASVDGKSTAGGRTAPLADDGDREAFHLLRTQADAVLIGAGTLRIERYRPLMREQSLRQIRTAEGREEQPLAVVISASGQIPFDIPLFTDPSSRVILFTAATDLTITCAAQVEVHPLAPTAGSLTAMMRSLRLEHGVRSILCEGGPTLLNNLLALDLVDETFITLAPSLRGGGELGITEGPAIRSPSALALTSAFERNGYLFLRYGRARPEADAGRA